MTRDRHEALYEVIMYRYTLQRYK